MSLSFQFFNLVIINNWIISIIIQIKSILLPLFFFLLLLFHNLVFPLFNFLFLSSMLSFTNCFICIRQYHIKSLCDFLVSLFWSYQWIRDIAKYPLSCSKFSEIQHKSLLYSPKVIEWILNLYFGVSALHISQCVVRLHQMNWQLE